MHRYLVCLSVCLSVCLCFSMPNLAVQATSWPMTDTRAMKAWKIQRWFSVPESENKRKSQHARIRDCNMRSITHVPLPAGYAGAHASFVSKRFPPVNVSNRGDESFSGRRIDFRGDDSPFVATILLSWRRISTAKIVYQATKASQGNWSRI